MHLRRASIDVDAKQKADHARRSTAPSPEPCPHPSVPFEGTELSRFTPHLSGIDAVSAKGGCELRSAEFV
ncbi:hypothetical protein ANO14919_058790 [Xylariales sp. No.14919]|nr:hypothetical protein ANO14919_058790 [Xylariales sp. No.14919]